MKATLLKDYKINPRAIAEAMWGTGGTNATRTNRRGAYYYSCSAHGGYVVSLKALTEEEKALLNQYTETMKIQALVQHRTDGDYVIAVSLSTMQRYIGKNRKQFRYTPHLGKVEWVDIEFYAFEEDCDWAILEKLTDIRANGSSTISDTERQEIIDRTFSQWATPKRKTPEGEK